MNNKTAIGIMSIISEIKANKENDDLYTISLNTDTLSDNLKEFFKLSSNDDSDLTDIEIIFNKENIIEFLKLIESFATILPIRNNKLVSSKELPVFYHPSRYVKKPKKIIINFNDKFNVINDIDYECIGAYLNIIFRNINVIFNADMVECLYMNINNLFLENN